MYRYQLYTPSKYAPCSEPTGPVYRDGSLANVKRHALCMLGVAYETDYSARVTRRPYVSVQWRGKDGQWHGAGDVEQPVRYVPSVGDLGWTP